MIEKEYSVMLYSFLLLTLKLNTMITILFLLIYILSFFWIRFTYRLSSSKYFNIWLDKDCKADIFWFIPVINTFVAFLYTLLLIVEIINKKIKNKWFNGDL